MGCNCGKRRSTTAGGETLGYLVTYPDGSTTPEDAPLFSIYEAKTEVRNAGGGTIKRLVRKPAEAPAP
ncbi:hypothetical protein SEA_YAGO84_9 [Gordonia phage Yago84]|nr:hypothetical protein SEA_YAGO84_9 [Gordonia phage Yago84]QIG58936.1 hypothetical protein SEA_ANCLAR_9 [Gordonia phage AnClar]WIC89991.1 hypothetical protein SEA_SISKO_9 [Gordonia phage Sisko]